MPPSLRLALYSLAAADRSLPSPRSARGAPAPACCRPVRFAAPVTTFSWASRQPCPQRTLPDVLRYPFWFALSGWSSDSSRAVLLVVICRPSCSFRWHMPPRATLGLFAINKQALPKLFFGWIAVTYFNFVRRHRLGEQEPLHFVAAKCFESRALSFGLDTLGEHTHAELMAKKCDRLC